MPDFTNTLIGVEPICDANCTVVFKKKDATVLSPEGKPILQGWREKKLPRLWRFSLKPHDRVIQNYTTTNQKRPAVHSAYGLPIIEALIRYMHAAAVFPVKSTCLKAIKKGTFESWPGFTYKNAAKYFPHSVETLKGHMVKSSQGVRSTKKNKHQANNNKKKPIQGTLQKQSEAEDITPPQKNQELHIWDQPISKLYTDDFGRFPIRSRSGNEYIMITCHRDSNTIMQAPFFNRKDKHKIRAYKSIMQRLADRGHHVEVQILDNEVSAEFKNTIVKDCVQATN